MEIDYNKELFVPDHIKTFTGIYFNAFDPQPDLIDIRDIAHALSQQPRYGGHLPKFYSVAQHSLYCSRLAPTHLKLCALLHDAAEAYLPDLPSPIKARMPQFKAVENNIFSVILKKFGIFETYYTHADELKAIDIQALKDEWNFLMQGRRCNKPLFPALSALEATNYELVETKFLKHFEEFTTLIKYSYEATK